MSLTKTDSSASGEVAAVVICRTDDPSVAGDFALGRLPCARFLAPIFICVPIRTLGSKAGSR